MTPELAALAAKNPRADDVFRKRQITRSVEKMRGKYVWYVSEYKGHVKRCCVCLSVWRKWSAGAEILRRGAE